MSPQRVCRGRRRGISSIWGALAVVLLVLLSGGVLLVACGNSTDSTTESSNGSRQTIPTTAQGDYLLAMSDASRLSPTATETDISAVAKSTVLVGADLYKELASQAAQQNLVFSPASIVTALAMTYAGAAGTTAEEMAQHLHFTLADQALHQAFNALDLQLEARNWEQTNPDGQRIGVLLRTANSLWGQKDLAFQRAFLDVLAANYGAGLRLVDFLTAPEEARKSINSWVAEQTEKKIPELIPKGVIDTLTRLVLVNAVYLDATWSSQFNPELTRDGSFTRLDGSKLTVPMMNQTAMFPYVAGEGWQAVELPYAGEELAMILLVPDEGQFGQVEERLNSGLLDEVFAALGTSREVALTVPKFKFRTQSDVDQAFRDLGMKTPFEPGRADFSKMSNERDLYISDIVHEAYIAVDEQGTEAAAATAVIIGRTAMPMDRVTLVIDRPFIFALRDRQTGALLFFGRVLDPSV